MKFTADELDLIMAALIDSVCVMADDTATAVLLRDVERVKNLNETKQLALSLHARIAAAKALGGWNDA